MRALHVRTPLCAVGLYLSHIRHDSVGLLCRLPELSVVCELGSGWCAGGRGVLLCIFGTGGSAVTESGAVLATDFAADVVDGIYENYFRHNT